jgi:hypothetical protein
MTNHAHQSQKSQPPLDIGVHLRRSLIRAAAGVAAAAATEEILRTLLGAIGDSTQCPPGICASATRAAWSRDLAGRLLGARGQPQRRRRGESHRDDREHERGTHSAGRDGGAAQRRARRETADER